DFLSTLRNECLVNGALLIFDEVITGFRLARGGAQEIYGVRPDLTALGKVIGGGLPVGAFGGRAEIMDQLSPDGPVYQAGTLSGNPLAMAAGLAQLRELDRINGWKLLEELGADLERRVHDALGSSKIEATFHRIGPMLCLFFALRPIVDLAGEKKFFVKGVTYGPFKPDEHGHYLGRPEQLDVDLAMMREVGLNVVRIYHAPPHWFLDRCAAAGMRVLITLPWAKHIEFLRQRSAR